ncbi:MAG: hypothetical protein CVU05_15390 [Bacteroidetes bacterium HGW-Bacteroidetes-21]|jgi:branched-subunit amino acid permease|nr:MAG: hypothetical protein CVU05_15390 [Bacteroidetes bacterium HGW-Bacteroidetes-21]
MLKKIASYLLMVFVLFFTVMALLAVWDVIDIENVIAKTLTSLFIIFVAALVVLFIFAVIIPERNNKNQGQVNP